ncbi:ketoacyl-synt-domain-containing protein [Aspergillus eucalypticola CBS 122712]|uniref:Ketoacyl-synt-domain-containing protein n=1 Tax=Aspergillus eucalypticola (strain CBS 122712 / IBT 29274) TaxID=1448314 RepID=A0A317WDL8_ASPEC|nr:ketoacyl-synt-domain-containing protein [Aspergillus eucalypticola CBS 122712]PWY84065.1 ketoacyl-synt-domain-containing protein [Aspergillus eucalypticola CBS 122712]
MDHPASTTPCEPIAIIGIGCRLPGQASSPSKLWDLLINNVTGYGSVPPSRYNAAAYYHPDADRPGSINSTGGYFIQEDINAFENALFGINNLEATSMDPQQRKLLEVMYEALENAGVPLETVRGSNMGVYVGNFTKDYLNMQYKDPEYSSRYTATGTGLAVLANRITHCFDLRGPSHVVDTACSSSLYALHSACLALDAGDCDAAVVAAANLIQSPEQQMVAVKAEFCRLMRCVTLLMKRRTAMVGHPAFLSQVWKGKGPLFGRRIIGQAWIRERRIMLRVGDPTEVEAISSVSLRRKGCPILVGGVKPNLGHSEGASGLSGLLKTILALENKIIPATARVKIINPRIKCKDWNVDIVTANQAWPGSRTPRASINSFGFGGSNSHAIVEAWEADLLTNGYGESPVEEDPARLYILPLSARSETSLRRIASDLAEYVAHSSQPIPINDLAYTLSCRRSKMATRGFFIECQASLNKGLDMSNPRLRGLDNERQFSLCFVYTGQGTQWAGMANELLSISNVFIKAINYLDFCRRALHPKNAPAWTLEGILRGDENRDISAAEISQLLCTAVQIALTDMLKDWGVFPEMVVGHSSGEIGAAYAIRAIDARQAIFAAYFRGAVVAGVSAEGSMVAVGLGKDQAQAIVDNSTTVSGDADAIDSLLKMFPNRGIWARNLMTGGTAYHSHHMKAVGPRYEALLKRYWYLTDGQANGHVNEHVNGHINGYLNDTSDGHVNDHDNGSVNGYANGQLDGQGDAPTPSVTMISTATGGPISTSQVGMPKYWRSNLESPVHFDAAIKIILEQGSHHLIELGPHSALQLPIKQTSSDIKQSRYTYNSALIRHQNAQLTILQLVGFLYLHGHDELQYHKMFADIPQPHVLVDLPATLPLGLQLTYRIYMPSAPRAGGDNVSEFEIGDRVVAMAPSHFATVERLPEWAVIKNARRRGFYDSLHDSAGILNGHLCTASSGEYADKRVLLIHSAAGGVGMAAIQYAKHLGAKIFATVGNETKKSFLVETYGLDPAHIFNSRNSSFLPAIMEATSGQGVDVMLNSLTGDLLRSSFEACASFCRFIDTGKRDILDHGLLDMSTFGRNVSLMAFDLSNLYLSKNQTHHRLWKALLKQSLELVRAKICEPCIMIKTFEASDITDAVRHFSLGTTAGQNPNTKIRLIPKKYETANSAQKYYLMIRGLGGLGRSISKWMTSCGARRFIFLSRSGTDKAEAKGLVDDLQAQGAHIIVIRGDVCRYEDFEQAVEAADCPIGGVIQASMALDEAI